MEVAHLVAEYVVLKTSRPRGAVVEVWDVVALNRPPSRVRHPWVP